MPTASNSAAPRTDTRIPELDGLRGIAIGMVLFFHFFGQTIKARPGSTLAHLLVPFRLSWSGVDLFFVLSGFLIGGILLDAQQSKNYFAVFYRRRFFRIIPAYAVLLGFQILLGNIGLQGEAKKFAVELGAKGPFQVWMPYLFFLQNFFMAPSNSIRDVDVTWSLAIEEQFYLTLPLLIRFLKPRQLVRTALLVILFALLLRCTLIWLWPAAGLSRLVLMPCRADALMLGVLAAILVRKPNGRTYFAKHRRAMRLTLLVLGAGFPVLTLRAPGSFDRGLQTVGLTWLAAFYACILMYAVTSAEGWIGRFLRLHWLRWLGGIAYGVYLFHVPILQMTFWAVRRHVAGIYDFFDLGAAVLALVATLAVCWLSWVYFEKPLIKIGHKTNYQLGERVWLDAAPSELTDGRRI